jgi:hypothetical protein
MIEIVLSILLAALRGIVFLLTNKEALSSDYD